MRVARWNELCVLIGYSNDVKIDLFNPLGMTIIWPYSKFFIDHDFLLTIAEFRKLLL